MDKRISIDPEICHGKPVISGTRVLVSNILAELGNKVSIEKVLEEYPNITREDIAAALEFGSRLAQFEIEAFEESK
jgi:uncharacterized protein (DUF433 family)